MTDFRATSVAIALALLPVGAALGGCGGGTASVAVVTSPFTDEQAEVLEDGVDFVDDPTVLEGRWRDDWSRDLDKRVSFADGIYIVEIRTVRTDTDLDRRVTYRLIAEVKSALFGQPPEDDELSLPVKEGAAGFPTVEGNEQRILSETFVAFLKWYETEEGTILPHWHLSPATDGVVSRVEYLIENRRSERRIQRGNTIEVVH